MTFTLDHAISLLTTHELVAFPTETVYGMGARADSERAVKKIYALKGRPAHNPLIVHVSSLERAEAFAEIPSVARRLAEAFWPGPLTLVLPLRNPGLIAETARAGLKTVAVRMPNHPVALELLKTIDLPLVAPSANLSNHVSPTHSAHVRDHFPDLPCLEGGACDKGVESTILDVSGPAPTLLRPGSISPEQIEAVLGTPVSRTPHSKTINAPGQLALHYAPKVPLRMNVTTPLPPELHIGFGEIHGELTLSASGDLEEAAQNLFHLLRVAEKTGQPIAVAPIPLKGVGLALNDRLTRASANKTETP